MAPQFSVVNLNTQKMKTVILILLLLLIILSKSDEISQMNKAGNEAQIQRTERLVQSGANDNVGLAHRRQGIR
jgi:hypothetical protein